MQSLKEIGSEKEIAEDPEAIEELRDVLEEGIRFDGIAIKTLPASVASRLTNLKQLEMLSFANCKLTGVESLPSLPGLKCLDLSDNNLKGDELRHIATKFPNLHVLLLGGNQVKALAELEHLKGVKQLQSLDLFNNPVTNVDKYRETTFKNLPLLESLDYKDAEGNDVEFDDGDDEGLEGEEEDDFIEDDEDDEAGPRPAKKPRGPANGELADADDDEDDDGEEEFLEDGDEEEED